MLGWDTIELIQYKSIQKKHNLIYTKLSIFSIMRYKIYLDLIKEKKSKIYIEEESRKKYRSKI